MMSDIDSVYLLQTLEQAGNGLGFCAPNPSVGALVVKDNKVIATGFHAATGQLHAEIIALNKCQLEETIGATLYVSLEPCCHWGKTPPCTETIINRKIKRVVFGHLDKNPKVNGKGHQVLQEAGIIVEQLSLPEIKAFYKPYDYWLSAKKPTITAKIAITLDGKIALPGGKPAAITSPLLKEFTHKQRLKHDAILTTAKTIIADNPQLNIRLNNTVRAKPLYILDRKLITPLEAEIFRTNQQITLFYDRATDNKRRQLLEEKNAKCIAVSCNEDGLNWQEITSHIGAQGIHTLWIEAGGTCFTSLLKKQLLNEAYIYVAPKCLGNSAVPAFTESLNLVENARDIKWHTFGKETACQISW